MLGMINEMIWAHVALTLEITSNFWRPKSHIYPQSEVVEGNTVQKSSSIV